MSMGSVEKTGARGRVTILVVEDEVLLRMLIADELRAAGYAVAEAPDGHQALDTLSGGARVRVIFADIQMPGSINGIDLARWVRSRHPHIKIVLTSAHYAAIDEVEHDGFFPKPYDTRRVISHVGSLLA